MVVTCQNLTVLWRACVVKQLPMPRGAQDSSSDPAPQLKLGTQQDSASFRSRAKTNTMGDLLFMLELDTGDGEDGADMDKRASRVLESYGHGTDC